MAERGARIARLAWGGSSAGRASRSQCEGRGFDPLPLHHQIPGFMPRVAFNQYMPYRSCIAVMPLKAYDGYDETLMAADLRPVIQSPALIPQGARAHAGCAG